MAKNTLKLNQVKEKPRREFQIVIASNPDWKQIFIQGDEISNVDGIVEVWADGDIVAIVNDFILIHELKKEKTPG